MTSLKPASTKKQQ